MNFGIESEKLACDFVFATQSKLAERWSVSQKKLEADRLTGKGCPYIKIGSLVRYRLSDILAFEEANLRRSTSEIGGPK